MSLSKKCLFLAFALVSMMAKAQDLAKKELVWEDDFEGNTLSQKNWNYETGDGCPNLCGWGNHERQIYSKDYVEVKNGNLIITADKVGDKYYSGKINTKDKFEFRYGSLEVRAKLPGGQGIWPAIWMLGADIDEVGWPAAGEIDIKEFVGRQPDTIHTSLHTPASHGNTINTKVTHIPELTDDFHLFRIDWNKDAIVFYIDEEKVYTFSPRTKNEETYPFRDPFYLLLNMAVGGDFGGPEVDDSIFPRKYIIDYVRVYK
ncbi:MAG: glycoside hydrolase family 16 protein [Salegentibacter sp.]